MSSPQPPGHEELLAPEGVVGSTVAASPPSPAPDGLGRGAGSGSPRSAHEPPEEVCEASEETLGCDTGQGDHLRYQLMRGQDSGQGYHRHETQRHEDPHADAGLVALIITVISVNTSHAPPETDWTNINTSS